MKHSLYYIILLTLAFQACKKDNDRVFDKSPDERLAETLSNYQNQLNGSTYGWRAVVEPASGSAYGFYFKFSDSNRVRMYSEFTTTSSVTIQESSFRLKGLQQPALIFDTYSYLHELADPDNRVNGGIRGEGLRSDFEFYFESVSADTIRLVGRYNGSKAMLIPATQAEATAYGNGGLQTSMQFDNYYNSMATYWKTMVVNGVTYQITFSPDNHTVVLAWMNGTTPQTFTTTYYYGSTGIHFSEALINGSAVINSLTNIVRNAVNGFISVTVNNTATVITTAAAPIYVDRTAAKRWYDYVKDQEEYWISLTGFTVNGIKDAFGITSLSNVSGTFYFYAYWPEYYSDPADIFAPVMLKNGALGLNSYYTAPASPPAFTQDGRIVFTALGGIGTTPVNGPVARSNALLYNTNGFYLVQTSPTSYDMVSASDGRSWINWLY